MPKVTERTFYPILIDIIRELKGEGIQEISCSPTEPDILFTLCDRTWLLGIKIGESPSILKQAFLQYLRHKEDSKINHGVLLFLPDHARSVKPNAQAVKEYLEKNSVYCLLDTPNFREEAKGITFRTFLKDMIIHKMPVIEEGKSQPFSLSLAIKLLKEHLVNLMQVVHLKEEDLINLVTHKDLFSKLAHFSSNKDMEYVGRFLAAYILLSQLMFLRILYHSRQDIRVPHLTPVSSSSLRRAFNRILEVNYRPIFSLDVLGSLDEKYIKETFDIIWGLKIEDVQYELPGRIYNELMPPELRKLLAAFFTRPIAAEMLAHLSIEKSNVKILDPACGSGTLLVAGYKRKKACYYNVEHKTGNPHQRFCEQDIHGIDIMPFSAHLSAANIAACDPRIPVDHTKITAADSLKIETALVLEPGIGVSQKLFPDKKQPGNESFKIDKVDVVLMNPPFTKLERGIQQVVQLDRFGKECGNEVGLWGHFIPLAFEFLKEDGIIGAVLPISILRGRESSKIREYLFTMFTPLYIIKPVVNYGFSESAEYRDIMIIAKKGSHSSNKKTQFVLFRENILSMTEKGIIDIVNQIKSSDSVSTLAHPVHVLSVDRRDIQKQISNLMYYCGFSNFEHRELLINFLDKYTSALSFFPDHYFREGYCPRPEGISKVFFLTRDIGEGRTQEAFLSFKSDLNSRIECYSKLDSRYSISKKYLKPSIRTSVGLKNMCLDGKIDYITIKEHDELRRIALAVGFDINQVLDNKNFWDKLNNELKRVGTYLVIIRKINPFSPNSNLVSFFSHDKLCPSNTFHPVLESNPLRAKAMCVIFNSILFWIHFFCCKGETTGRHIDVRHSDLYGMRLYPADHMVKSLSEIFDNYASSIFPAFKDQMDDQFDHHYQKYRDLGLLTFEKEFRNQINPSLLRLEFDKDVIKALGYDVDHKELVRIYRIVAKEMMVIKNLSRE